MHFILASASPRRKELLAQILPSFEVIVPNVDEGHEALNDPTERAVEIAKDKAAAVAELHPDACVIAADTIVALLVNGSFVHLGKPSDHAEARRMLRMLSGRSHLVVTGVAVYSPEGQHVFSETTRVTFRELSSEEIDRYILTGEPMDKAGAYAIQGGAGAFATTIEGSLNNVIGLPTERLAPLLTP